MYSIHYTVKHSRSACMVMVISVHTFQAIVELEYASSQGIVLESLKFLAKLSSGYCT